MFPLVLTNSWWLWHRRGYCAYASLHGCLSVLDLMQALDFQGRSWSAVYIMPSDVGLVVRVWCLVGSAPSIGRGGCSPSEHRRLGMRCFRFVSSPYSSSPCPSNSHLHALDGVESEGCCRRHPRIPAPDYLLEIYRWPESICLRHHCRCPATGGQDSMSKLCTVPSSSSSYSPRSIVIAWDS